MQPVTDEQAAILRSDALEVDYGLELLSPTLQVLEDISADLAEGGQVTRNMNREPHGQCALRLTRALRWGIDLVRPYMVLTDTTTGATARWSIGVFALTTPSTPVGEDPVTYDVQGYDRLYLLQREVAAEYTALAGVSYRQALLDAFTAAGLTQDVLIEGSAADDVLPTTRVWSLVGRSTDPDQDRSPATWLRVVNDLLEAINFRSVWADSDGRIRCQAYQPPNDRPVEFTFSADDPRLTILGAERTVTSDVWQTPNRWLFRQTNRPQGAPVATIGDGLYEVTLPDEHPLSAVSRGLDWPRVVDYEAATQAKLVELGDRRVAYDLRVTTSIEVRTGPFPPAGHADVFTYDDLDAGGSRKVQAVEWALPLSGADMTWTWEAA